MAFGFFLHVLATLNPIGLVAYVVGAFLAPRVMVAIANAAGWAIALEAVDHALSPWSVPLLIMPRLAGAVIISAAVYGLRRLFTRALME